MAKLLKVELLNCYFFSEVMSVWVSHDGVRQLNGDSIGEQQERWIGPTSRPGLNFTNRFNEDFPKKLDFFASYFFIK